MEIYNDTYCVYVHINKINGKMYVGRTINGDNPEKRWGSDGFGYKKCPLFWKAICKYGWNNFEHEIIASALTKNEADNFERLLIDKLRTRDRNYGYNLTDGGDGFTGEFTYEHRKHMSEAQRNRPPRTEETRRKLSEAIKGEKHPFYGKHLSEEHKKKIGDAQRGIPVTDVARMNMCKGQKGHIVTEETKRKISESHKGVNGPKAKSVLQFDLNGKFIRQWDFIKQASEEICVNKNSISACCRGIYKTAGGFIWRYANCSETPQND
jgi:group I intron endonuclease